MANDGPSTPPHRLDDLLLPGWYMLRVCVLMEVMIFSQVAFMYYMMYAGAAATITSCGDRVPSLSEDGYCSLYSNGSCPEPQLSYQFKSVNAEWNFLCDDTSIVKSAIAMQMLGVIIGTMTFGQLGDSFGRKKCLVVTMVGTAIAFVITSYAIDLRTFTLARTVAGIFIGGQISLLNVFVLENIPKSMRMCTSMAITWSPNIVLLAGVAYLTGSWSFLSFVVGLMSIPGVVMSIFGVNESPRWLLQKGRIEEAKSVMYRIYKCNGHAISKETIDRVFDNEVKLMEQKKGKKQYSFHDIFSHFSITVAVFVISFSYFATAVINYGIVFNMEKLAGSIYLNSAINGGLRYFFNLSFAILEPRMPFLGRKAIHTISVLTIIVAVGTVFYANVTKTEMKEICRYALILAASMASQVFISCGVIGNELLPTPVRAIGYSILQSCSRFGVVIAPFLSQLAYTWEALPMLTMLVLAVINLVMFQTILPETRGRPMPESMPSKRRRGYQMPPEQQAALVTV